MIMICFLPRENYSAVPNKRPNAYQFWKFLTQELSNFNVKSLMIFLMTIFKLHCVIRINSFVQKLILDLLSSPTMFTSIDYLGPSSPVY